MVDVPGGALFTLSGGSPTAPPAVLVHSGIAHARMWLPLLRGTYDDLFGIAYDCRCFGRSTTRTDVTYSDTEDLGSVLDAYAVGPVVLIGESRGARIALDFALAHPDRVRGLFLTAPDISGFDAPVSAAEQKLRDAIEAADRAGEIDGIIAHEARLLVDGPTRGPDPERAALRRGIAEMSRANYAQQQDDVPDHTAVDAPAATRLAELACPVHVLVGEADTTGTQAMAAALEEECPKSTLVRVPDAAHALALERPETVERELRTWLRTI
ncbi:alpha/beta hydrolase [Streptomyces sp. NPDC048106]|uniref:alpha/beta fold hydrolase n=1 Tax=Streptomyces sp. NPDC048106 TaxID=3155750 RepID=UPI00345717A3